MSCGEEDKPRYRFSPEALALLAVFDWTEGFRQLVNLTKYVRGLLRGGVLAGVEHVKEALAEQRRSFPQASDTALIAPGPAVRSVDALPVLAAVEAENGNKSRAAIRANLTRQHVGRICSRASRGR